MTNEKSLQVAQGLSILSLLIASGRIDGGNFARRLNQGTVDEFLEELAASRSLFSDEDRARLLDAIEMVSP